MTSRTTAQENRHMLAGIVKCTACGAVMVNLGGEYICPRNITKMQEPCSTMSINSERLLRALMTRLVMTLNSEPTVSDVVTLLQEQTETQSAQAKNYLDEAETALMELNDRKRIMRGRASEDVAADDAFREESDQMDRQTAALAYQARISRRELDGYEFVNDEDRIRATLAQVETYLDDADPADTAEMINLLVRDVTIGQDTATVNYKGPLPKEGYPEGVTSERIPLE
jgi:hypothetical protein